MTDQTPEEKHLGLMSSLNSASPLDKKVSYLLILLFSACASISLGVPIMFKDPLIYCIEESTGSKFICSEIDACSNKYVYLIDKINGPKSFTSDFDLICENSYQKRFAITMNFFGYFIGCFVITFFPIKASIRKKALALNSIIYGICLLLMLFFSDSLLIISILLFISSFCFICINAYVYVYITENFVGNLASSMMILVNVGWAYAGIFYAIFAFLVNSNWMIFLGFGGLIMLILGIYFWMMDFPKDYSHLPSNQGVSIFENFKTMWSYKQIFKNFLVYSLIWPLYIFCYNCVLIELESVGGNLYINLILCSIIEILAALLTSYLSKFNYGRTLKWLYLFLSIFFIFFIFAPLNLAESPFYVTMFFIVMMLSGKICYDIVSLLVYIYIPKVMTDKYVPLFLIFSRFLSRFFNLFIPYINFFFRSVQIHPFVFLGIMWLISRFCCTFTREVQNDGVDNLLNEYKISLIQKLSVMSGGKSMASIPHDDFLKNIVVKGSNLSVIRKSRFQTSILNMGNKKSTSGGGIMDALLKDPMITELKEKYIAEDKY